MATLQDFFARRPEDQGEDADEKAEGKEEKETEKKGACGGKKSGNAQFYLYRIMYSDCHDSNCRQSKIKEGPISKNRLL